MKKIVLLLPVIIFTLAIVSCSKSDEEDERPDEIISTEIRAETLLNIETMFVQDVNVKVNQPLLFEPTSDKLIILSKESEVYVTFVSENASYLNSLGYYTYNANAFPANAAALDLHILFPNVSDGILKQGDMLQVGTSTFPAGTVIGFFIIINGWEKGSVHYERDKIYTDMVFNLGGEQQHVLFQLKDFGDLVLGFEDILIAASGNHYNDFNDLLFTVTDNKDRKKATSFELENVIVLE